MYKTKGFFALLTTGFLYGLYGIFIRFLSEDLTGFQLYALTHALGLIILAGILFWRKPRLSLRGIPINHLLLYGFAYAAGGIFFTLSTLQTKISTTVFLLYGGSFTTTFLVGHFIFHEKLTRQRLISLGTAFAGLLFFTNPFSSTFLSFGLIVGLLSGICDGLSNTSSKFVSGKADEFIIAGFRLVGALILVVPLLILYQQTTIPALSGMTILYAVLFSLSIIAAAYSALIGFENFDLNLGTIVMSSELVFATILAFLLFQEIPAFNEVLGGLLIISAIIFSNYNFKNK